MTTRIKNLSIALLVALALLAAPMVASTMVDGEVVGVNVAQAGGCQDGTGC